MPCRSACRLLLENTTTTFSLNFLRNWQGANSYRKKPVILYRRMKNAKKYRAAVIGCGTIGLLYESEKNRPLPRSHAGALAADRRIQLVALVDQKKAHLDVAKKYF